MIVSREQPSSEVISGVEPASDLGNTMSPSRHSNVDRALISWVRIFRPAELGFGDGAGESDDVDVRQSSRGRVG